MYNAYYLLLRQLKYLFKKEKTNFSMPVRCANIATETWSPHEGEVYLHILNDNASRCNSGK